MNTRVNPFAALEMQTRRRFLAASGTTLSAAAIAMLAGRPALAAARPATADEAQADARILNTALGAELEAIAAYGVGAQSGLLQKLQRASCRVNSRGANDVPQKAQAYGSPGPAGGSGGSVGPTFSRTQAGSTRV